MDSASYGLGGIENALSTEHDVILIKNRIDDLAQLLARQSVVRHRKRNSVARNAG